jgi:hypothetical protein
LVQQALPDLETDPGYFPFVAVEAAVAEPGIFDWGDFERRALMALDEPLIDDKIDYGLLDSRRTHYRHSATRSHKAIPSLRWVLPQCFRYRRPAVFIVDDAQHFTKAENPRQLCAQAECLLSLVEATEIVFLMFGTYELLTFKNLNAHLDQCSVNIHFPRYRFDKNEDCQAFQRVLLTFQRYIPLPNEPDLISDAEYFYERSTGCVGVLKDWFYRALAETIADGQRTLTRAYLDRHALRTDKLLRMAREIREGEEKLQQLHQPITTSYLDTQPAPTRTLKSDPSVSRSKRQKRRVGERKPTRDKVRT